jgi:hypothetical protein
MACTYVKEFDFKKTAGDMSSAKQKYADGGPVSVAVHKHEKALHKGEPLTKLARGGKVPANSYPSREAMVKRESKETPRMQREELVQRSKVMAPARRSVPVAPTSPLVAMKNGGSAGKMSKVMGEFKSGELHSGSKSGPEVTNPKQAVAIAMSEARKSAKR